MSAFILKCAGRISAALCRNRLPAERREPRFAPFSPHPIRLTPTDVGGHNVVERAPRQRQGSRVRKRIAFLLLSCACAHAQTYSLGWGNTASGGGVGTAGDYQLSGFVALAGMARTPGIILTNPPQNQTAFVGGGAQFSVGASGDPVLYYQWFYNGAPIGAATNASLALANLAIPGTNSLFVVVTNSFATVTSAPVTLIIHSLTAAQADALSVMHDQSLSILPGDLLANDAASTANGSLTNLGIASISDTSSSGGALSVSLVENWAQRYNGGQTGIGWTDYDFLLGLEVSRVGNVHVVGTSPHFYIYSVPYPPYSSFATDNDFVGVNYSASGSALSTNRIHLGSNGNNEGARAVVATDSGEEYVGGYATGNGNDFFLVKYSPSGSAIWTNRYDGTGNGSDSIESLALLSDGSVIAAGTSFGSGSENDFVTIRYSSAGSGLWTNRFNGPANGRDTVKVVAAQSGSNIVVAGSSTGGVTNDFLVVRYSRDGALLSSNRYDGPANGNDEVAGLAVDLAGNIYVTGWSAGTTSRTDVATMKFAPDGSVLWTNRYEAPAGSNAFAAAIGVDAAGNAYVAGRTGSEESGEDFLLLKYASDGTAIWTNRWSSAGINSDRPASLAVAADGSVIVTGSGTYSTNADFVTIRYTPAGAPTSTNVYQGPENGEDVPVVVKTDVLNDVYVAGNSFGSAGSAMDFATVKYSKQIRYTPPAGFFGLDSFTYLMNDVAGRQSTGTVWIGVWSAPAFVAQPQSQTNYYGSAASLSALAVGYALPTYQWLFNGAPIPGATQTNLTLNSVTAANDGNYQLVASNAVGVVTSAVAVLTVDTLPIITQQPQSTSVVPGGNLLLSAAAVGYGPFSYQWRLNGTNISGATSDTLALTGISAELAGAYSVVVTGPGGSRESLAATVWMLGNLDLHPVFPIYGAIGAAFRIQYTTNLSEPVNWTDLMDMTLSANQVWVVDPTPARTTGRYYRAVLLP